MREVGGEEGCRVLHCIVTSPSLLTWRARVANLNQLHRQLVAISLTHLYK